MATDTQIVLPVNEWTQLTAAGEAAVNFTCVRYSGADVLLKFGADDTLPLASEVEGVKLPADGYVKQSIAGLSLAAVAPTRVFARALGGRSRIYYADDSVLDVDAPLNTTPPVAAGATASGSALSCDTGLWDNAIDSFTFQWKRDATPIADETFSIYTSQVADEGTNVTCTVTAIGPGGSTSEDSNAIAVVAP